MSIIITRTANLTILVEIKKREIERREIEKREIEKREKREKC